MNREELFEKGIRNGIGGKGSFNFSDFFEDNIKYFEEFLPEKAEEFKLDIEELSIYHDVAYYNGNTSFAKLKADLNFCIGFYKKLSWTSLRNRIGVFIRIFLILNHFGPKFFNYGQKQNITYDKL